MQYFNSRRFTLVALAVFGLGASTLLTGCWEKDDNGCRGPKGSVCNTAVTVVDLSARGGCGLALRLADGSYVVPTGSSWLDFHAKAGDRLLVGYPTKHDDDDRSDCPAGPAVKLGCVSLNPGAI